MKFNTASCAVMATIIATTFAAPTAVQRSEAVTTCGHVCKDYCTDIYAMCMTDPGLSLSHINRDPWCRRESDDCYAQCKENECAIPTGWYVVDPRDSTRSLLATTAPAAHATDAITKRAEACEACDTTCGFQWLYCIAAEGGQKICDDGYWQCQGICQKQECPAKSAPAAPAPVTKRKASCEACDTTCGFQWLYCIAAEGGQKICDDGYWECKKICEPQECKAKRDLDTLDLAAYVAPPVDHAPSADIVAAVKDSNSIEQRQVTSQQLAEECNPCVAQCFSDYEWCVLNGDIDETICHKRYDDCVRVCPVCYPW